MQRDAIEYLHELSHTGEEVGTFTPSLLLHKNTAIQSLEHLQQFRSQFRGTFTTETLIGFCRYTDAAAKQYPSETVPQIFIDAAPASMSACAIFDIGNASEPGHCRHKALLKNRALPAYEALLKTEGQSLTQRQIIDYIEDWHDMLQINASDGSSMDPAAAISRLRNINIKATSEHGKIEGEFSRKASAMDAIELQEETKFPAKITLSAAPYPGLRTRKFTLQVGLLPNAEKPIITLRWVRKGIDQQEIADEFIAMVIDELTCDAEIHAGNFNPE